MSLDAVDAPRTMPPVVRRVAERFADLPQVVALAVGGSRRGPLVDAESDIDLYVFGEDEVPPAIRAAIARDHAEAAEIDNRFFGPGDEWRDERTGIKVDLIYWSPRWMEEQIDRVLVHHQASVGYSTCFWRTVRDALPLFDRTGWFAALQAKAARPYPEELRRAVVAMNFPLLRERGGSFLRQIELALSRHDVVSVQHRVTALLGSYFDVLFAINRLPHPGEKRLLEIARRECSVVPEAMEARVLAVIAAGASPADGAVIGQAHALIDGLEEVLWRDGLLSPEESRRPASEWRWAVAAHALRWSATGHSPCRERQEDARDAPDP